MQAPGYSTDERLRLEALAEYRILDTVSEVAFDSLTRLAAQVLEVPITLVSIVDAERQWFKSRFGLEAQQTPRDVSFCGHVVERGQPLVVADARADARFSDNPLVTGEPHVCFYAGMPLRNPSGFVLGTLCAIDHVPRTMAPEKLETLNLIAGQVGQLLELRRTGLLLDHARATAIHAEENLHKILDNIPAMVGYWDAGLRNVFANHRYTEWFGKTPTEIRGLHIRHLLGESLYSQNSSFLTRALAGEEQYFERTIPTPAGVRHSAAAYIPDRVGDEVRGLFVLVTDVTELFEARARLQELSDQLAVLARVDGLTGLLNRRAALELVSRESSRASRLQEPLFVAILDVDKFKVVNDTYGHAAGDDVLRQVSHSLRNSVRQIDICARWGGEEFFIVLSGTDDEGARKSIERIRASATASGPGGAVTLSAGLAEWRPSVQTVEQAIATADARLYAAKSTGRNRTVCDG